MREYIEHRKAEVHQQIDARMASFKVMALLHLGRMAFTEANFQTFERFFRIHEDPNAFSELEQLVGAGYMPIVFSNHQSHADILPMAYVTNKIQSTTRIQGFNVPSAKSLETGHQGKGLQEFTALMDPWLKAHGVHFQPVTRQKDVDIYDIRQNNRESMKKILGSRKINHGVGVFPEGSVQGGRRNAEGNINGLIEADAVFGNLINNLMHQGPVVFLPFSVNGSHQIFDTNTRLPTRHALSEVFLHRLHIRPITPLASVTIGRPFVGDVITGLNELPRQEQASFLNNYLMQQLAALLPVEAQGVYRT